MNARFLLLALLCLPCLAGCPSSTTTTPPSAISSPVTGSWYASGWQWWVTLSPDGSGETKDKDGKSRRFKWRGEQERIVVSDVSGDELPFPPKPGTYPYSYQASEQIQGYATISFAGEGKSWEFERK